VRAVRTTSSGFFVSMRNNISGEIFFLISSSLWIVMGFPNPQQFQLATFKEEDWMDFENPSYLLQ